MWWRSFDGCFGVGRCCLAAASGATGAASSLQAEISLNNASCGRRGGGSGGLRSASGRCSRWSRSWCLRLCWTCLNSLRRGLFFHDLGRFSLAPFTSAGTGICLFIRRRRASASYILIFRGRLSISCTLFRVLVLLSPLCGRSLLLCSLLVAKMLDKWRHCLLGRLGQSICFRHLWFCNGISKAFQKLDEFWVLVNKTLSCISPSLSSRDTVVRRKF